MNADATPPTDARRPAHGAPPATSESSIDGPPSHAETPPPPDRETPRRLSALRTIALHAGEAEALAAADRARAASRPEAASSSDVAPGEPRPVLARPAVPSAPPERGFSFDIFCLQCGYNLRGLAGDPIRCPECSFHNPLGDVEVPAPLIRRQLARMEEAPLLCVLALPIGVIVGFITATTLLVKVGTPVSWQTTALPGALAAGGSAALIVFVYGAVRFRSGCLRQPGWVAALARYLFGAFLALGAMIGAYLLTSRIAWALLLGTFPRRTATTLHQLLMVGFCVAALLVVRFAVRPLYELWMGPIHALQRQVAVEFARRDSRRRLLKHRAGG